MSVDLEPQVIDAIWELVPDAGAVVFDPADLSTVTVANGESPTPQQIEAKLDEMKAAWEARSYQRNRKFRYPPIEDLADAIYWNELP